MPGCQNAVASVFGDGDCVFTRLGGLPSLLRDALGLVPGCGDCGSCFLVGAVYAVFSPVYRHYLRD